MLILNDIIDEDSKAFDGVMELLKCLRIQKKKRKLEAIKYKKDIKRHWKFPLRCSEECFKVLELQEVFAFYGNKNAITDVGVGLY